MSFVLDLLLFMIVCCARGFSSPIFLAGRLATDCRWLGVAWDGSEGGGAGVRGPRRPPVRNNETLLIIVPPLMASRDSATANSEVGGSAQVNTVLELLERFGT